MKTLFKPFLSILIALTLTSGIAYAQDTRTPEEKEYVFRDSLFRVIEWKMGNLVGAKMKNDPAAFKKHASDMAYLAGLITEGFQIKGNMFEGTRALPAVWEDFGTFEERADRFQKAAQALASSGDMEGFDPRKFGRTNCGGCHKDFKKRDD